MTRTQRSRLIPNVPPAAAPRADSWRAIDESGETQRVMTLSTRRMMVFCWKNRRKTYLNSASVQMQSEQWRSGSRTSRMIHHLGRAMLRMLNKLYGNIYLLLKEGIILQTIPSLFMVIGMVWTVWSFTHELVSICSSSDVREKLLKPAWRQ